MSKELRMMRNVAVVMMISLFIFTWFYDRIEKNINSTNTCKEFTEENERIGERLFFAASAWSNEH